MISFLLLQARAPVRPRQTFHEPFHIAEDATCALHNGDRTLNYLKKLLPSIRETWETSCNVPSPQKNKPKSPTMMHTLYRCIIGGDSSRARGNFQNQIRQVERGHPSGLVPYYYYYYYYYYCYYYYYYYYYY